MIEFEDFSRTIKCRPVLGRSISFNQWLEDQGIDINSLPSDFEEGDCIGNLVFPQRRSLSQRGKQESLLKRVEEKRKLRLKYYEEVPEQQIGSRPIDSSRSDDSAYVRVLYKRINKSVNK